MTRASAPSQAFSPGAVVLFSGGMDSTVCLYRALRRFGVSRVRALTIDYGQRSGQREIEAAGAIVTPLGVSWDVVVIDVPWWRSTGLVGGGNVEGAAAVVPGRNTILVTLGAAHAQQHGLGEVWIGVCENDHAIFSDCRPSWATAIGNALVTSLGIALAAPLIGLSKQVVVEEAARLGAADAIRRSWSCYTPRGVEQCGECGACRQRAIGFGGAP